jgi:isopenicillin N synthase-like dioxygenase
MNTSFAKFESDGLISLSYPSGLRAGVLATIESWKKFCDLPLKVKKGLPYSNGGAGVGYEFKEGIGNKADHKENFDITLAGQKWLRANAEALHNPIVLDFIQNATSLITYMKPTILSFADQTEKAYKIKNFTDEVEQSEDAFFIRFIHYFGDRNVGDETASAHVDQSGFTLHLFESAPGLQCLPYKKDWIDMPVSEGETVIIPAMQMQLRSKGKLRALCHRVIATRETSRDGRFSAVCFIQLKDTPKYNKDRHGRLQEKTPGFNYKMSDKEFSKLFK